MCVEYKKIGTVFSVLIFPGFRGLLECFEVVLYWFSGVFFGGCLFCMAKVADFAVVLKSFSEDQRLRKDQVLGCLGWCSVDRWARMACIQILVSPLD